MCTDVIVLKVLAMLARSSGHFSVSGVWGRERGRIGER